MSRGDGRIFKRGNVWWMAFRVSAMRNGKVCRVEKRESTGVQVAEKNAERAAWGVFKARLKQINRPEWVGPYNEKLTVADLIEAYRTLRLPLSKNPASLRYNLNHLLEEFGPIRANALTPERVDEWRTKMIGVGYAPGSVDRYARIFRAVLNLAFRDRKIAFVPRITCFNPHDARSGFMEVGEFNAIHEELRKIDADVADMWEFSYYCGRRPSELANLQWKSVSIDTKSFVVEESKNEQAWPIPLGGPMWEVIQRRLTLRILDDQIIPWVFHRGGRRLDNNIRNKAFKRAKVAAGYPDRIFYDCRRTVARDLLNAGVDETTVMRMLGHKTRAMLDRYGIRSTQDMRRAQDRLAEMRSKLEKQPPKVIRIDRAG
jgi:integrase